MEDILLTREVWCMPQLNVVLVGGRNSGKSLVGNMILGREEFVTKERTTCSRRLGEVAGQWVSVVDTPGWWCDFSARDTPQQVKREIAQSVSLCLPGPHVFLVVIKASSVFSEKRCRAVEEHLALLGEGVWSHCLVLFTCSDWPKNMTVEQHVQRGGRALQWLSEKCSHRYHTINLKSERDGAQVTGLFEKMKRLVIENRSMHFEMGAQVLREVEERRRTVEQSAQQRFMKMKRQRSLLQAESRHLSDIRMVLLGARGSGKSSAGNTILDRGGSFATRRRTAQCEMRAGDVSGRHVTVVDTPGWWMNYFSEESPVFDQREVVRSLSLCPPGPHALLLVVRVDRAFTETYRRAVQEHLELISDRVWPHLMVVFSFGDWLGEATVEQYIESEGEALRWLVEKCGNRYHILNNKSNGNEFQVSELMGKIEEMVAGNSGHHCEIQRDVLHKLEEKMRTEEERASERLKRTQRQRDNARSLLGERHRPSVLRLVLLGTANTGKSSAGNTILGRQHFDESSQTLGCVEGHGHIRGQRVIVLDTPGWLCPGHEFLVPPTAGRVTVPLAVVNVSSSFTHSQRVTTEKHLEEFGEEVWSRAVVLFTFGDWLGDTNIQQRIESEGNDLQSLVDRCGNRYHVLDNKNRGTGGQVSDLLEKIEEMMVEERLEILKRGDQIGKSIRVVQEPQFDRLAQHGNVVDTPLGYTDNPSCDVSEVASSMDFLPPVQSEEPGIGGQVVALPGATGGKAGTSQLLLDREGFMRLASLIQGTEGLRWGTGGRQTLVNFLNIPDWLHTEYPLNHMKHSRRDSVSPFSPGPQAVVVVMPAEQPRAEDTRSVGKKEDTEVQALAHPRLGDPALREMVRSGDLQALIDHWGNSNLEELESFIDSYFQMIWGETMCSVMTEEESPADDRQGQDDVVDEPGAGVLTSIDSKLSKLEILETIQRDLLELKQTLERSCEIIQKLNDKSTIQEPADR